MGLRYNTETAVQRPLRYSSINSSLTSLTQSGEVIPPQYNSQEVSTADNYQVLETQQTFAGIAAGVTQTLDLDLSPNILILEFGYIATSTAGIDTIKINFNDLVLADQLGGVAVFTSTDTVLDQTNSFEEATVTISARNVGGIGNLTIGLRVKFIYL